MKPRKERSGLIVVTGIVLLAACSDGPTAPSNAARNAPVTSASLLSLGGSGDTSVQTFVVDPTKKTAISFGANSVNKVVFTASSICDVLLSSYGPDQWEQPCLPQLLPVTITVKSWYDASGHPHSDFQPHMRFNPAADPVVLTLKDKGGVQPGLAILYCADVASTCVDESVTDASLVTYRDPNNGSYYRRVKHFSGYNIASGTLEAENTDSSMDGSGSSTPTLSISY